MKQSSQEKVHTLDLVLSHGFCVDHVKLVEFTISDHNAVLFQWFLSSDPKPSTLICSCPLNSLSVPHFCQAFTSSNPILNTTGQYDCSVDKLVSTFNNYCIGILDFIAPGKGKRWKSSSLPWLNEKWRSLKRQYRKAEQKRKKDKLDCSLVSLQVLMSPCQCAVKEARNTYFSDLIAKQDHNSRLLLKP